MDFPGILCKVPGLDMDYPPRSGWRGTTAFRCGLRKAYMHNRSNRMSRSVAVVVLAVVAIAVGGAPAAAIAQQVSPTQEQYENGVLGVSAGGGTGGSETATDPGSGELPFTGLDLVAIVAIGVGLVGAGLAVRKVSRSHGDQAA